MTTPGVGLAKIDADSSDTVMSSLDLFASPPTHTSALHARWVDVPTFRTPPGAEIELEIPPHDDQYIDLKNSKLNMEIKVVRPDGTDLPAAGHNDLQHFVGDNFAHSLFDSASLSINGREVEHSGNYPYRAFTQNLLNFNTEAKETHLATAGWRQDDGLSKNGADMAAEVIAERKRVIGGSRTIGYDFRPCLSFFHQDRMIGPRNTVKLTLRRSPDTFSLISNAQNPNHHAVVKITKCSLFVRMVQVNPALQSAQEQAMIDGAIAKYPFTKVQDRIHVLPAGTQSTRLTLEQNGQKPKKLFVALLDHAAKSGQINLNPFKFSHYTVNSLELLVNGLPTSKRFEPDFANGVWSREYNNMMTILGKSESNQSNGITYPHYGHGQTVFAFEMMPDLCHDDGSHLISNANIELLLSFNTPLADVVSVYVYTELDDLCTIDLERRVNVVGGGAL